MYEIIIRKQNGKANKYLAKKIRLNGKLALLWLKKKKTN